MPPGSVGIIYSGCLLFIHCPSVVCSHLFHVIQYLCT